FQCLVLTPDGEVTLLTRSADLRQAQLTSTIKDIRVWKDGPHANPALDLKSILRDKHLDNKRVGVEYDAYGLTAANGKRLETAVSGLVHLEDASMLVTRVRAVKSNEELAYVRRAGELADDAWTAAQAVAKPGVDESLVLARMQSAVLEGGGDYPANEFVIGAGANALLCRYQSERKLIQPNDQLMLEWAGVYRHYHAAMMRTMLFGEPPKEQLEMFEAADQALTETLAELKPGNTFGDSFAAHARVFDELGLSEHRLNACGYSLGATFAPNWMDWPMQYEKNPTEIKPGMVIFTHMVLMNSQQNLSMCLGHTVVVTPNGPESVSKYSNQLCVVD
ncbi:MAG: M24 family metallopeptidase, partial [Alphaproteobacteria bacterium]